MKQYRDYSFEVRGLALDMLKRAGINLMTLDTNSEVCLRACYLAELGETDLPRAEDKPMYEWDHDARQSYCGNPRRGGNGGYDRKEDPLADAGFEVR